jgi:L-rhamnose mutarotase
MIRKAFLMSVFAGCELEYRRRHRSIWPELQRVLKAHGVSNYSIFLHPHTGQLFAYMELEDEAKWDLLARSTTCKKWWAHMAELMPHEPDESPCATDLEEVFHLS